MHPTPPDVEVRAGAGSNIVAPVLPLVYGPSLTREYVGR
jgi:hypothetical protein